MCHALIVSSQWDERIGSGVAAWVLGLCMIPHWPPPHCHIVTVHPHSLSLNDHLHHCLSQPPLPLPGCPSKPALPACVNALTIPCMPLPYTWSNSSRAMLWWLYLYGHWNLSHDALHHATQPKEPEASENKCWSETHIAPGLVKPDSLAWRPHSTRPRTPATTSGLTGNKHWDGKSVASRQLPSATQTFSSEMFSLALPPCRRVVTCRLAIADLSWHKISSPTIP